jgi:peptidoglycan/LPS O-acetylase OafA/YrhL
MDPTNPASHGRLHALDGLRAVMLLLGLVLHTFVSYQVVSVGAAWPYKDALTTPVADYVVAYIHVFRMPIFFVLAGFFAAMLDLKRGALGMLDNRARRILIPGALALLVLFPLTIGGFAFANAAKLGSVQAGWVAVQRAAESPGFWPPDRVIHLWFLYFLLYFYVLAVALAKVATWLPASWRTWTTDAFGALLQRPVLRVALPALLTAATLLPMQGRLLTYTGFDLYWPGLLAYFVFFAFGWLMYRHHAAMATFMRGAWIQVVASLGLFLVVSITVLPALGNSARQALPPGEADLLATIVRSLMGGLCAWFTFFGTVGLFLRYLNRESPLLRYLVDASYWVYLVHLPIVITIPGLIAGTGLPVALRIAVVLAGTFVLCFASYALFVRSTFIGQALNGRRYARGLPVVSGTPSPT